MSLLSAGKQIMVGGDKSYGRGLFVMDPDEADRKAQKQQQYQQQLRIQMQEIKRRKDEQKRKEREEDMRLEQKINEDIRRETEKKDKPNSNSDNNVATTNQRSQIIKAEVVMDAPRKNQYSVQAEKFNLKTSPAEMDYSRENPYLMKPAAYQYSGEESRFYEEVNNQKLKNLRQALEQKMSEVYKKIKGSQDLEVDKELEIIRRKIQSSNDSYENQNPKVPQFEEGYSHFYKVPKKKNFEESEIPHFKNMNYDTKSKMKRSEYPTANNHQQVSMEPKFSSSKKEITRELEGDNDQRAWGKKKGKGNFLGNREALDFQVDSIMGKIDNLLSKDYD